MADSIEIACEICQKTFTQKNNLKRHYVEAHPGMELPDSFKDLKDMKKTCPTCSKEISKSGFKRHLNSHITLSSAEPRSRKSVQENEFEDDDNGNDGSKYFQVNISPKDSEFYRVNMSLYKKEQPIEPMLLEYFSTKTSIGNVAVEKNYSRKNLDNHIFALKKFVEFYERSVELTPITLMECFESRFDEYFNTLEKVSQRSQILQGLQAAFRMFFYTKIYPEIPEIPQLRTPNQIIKDYLKSTHRFEIFQKLDRNAVGFSHTVGPLVIRNFLVTETVLATKSFDFVKELTREMFQKATEILDANDQTQWVIEIGRKKSFQIPDFLKAKIEAYLLLVRKHGVPKTDVKHDGKNDCWDPHDGDNIKLFAVSERGRLIGVQDTSSVFEDFHTGGQSHIFFRMKDFTGSNVKYCWPYQMKLSLKGGKTATIHKRS